MEITKEIKVKKTINVSDKNPRKCNGCREYVYISPDAIDWCAFYRVELKSRNNIVSRCSECIRDFGLKEMRDSKKRNKEYWEK